METAAILQPNRNDWNQSEADRAPNLIRPRGRECICSHLEYPYVTVDSSEAARELERRCRRCEIFKSMPTLNSLQLTCPQLCCSASWLPSPTATR